MGRRHDWREMEGDPLAQRCFRCGLTRFTNQRDRKGRPLWTEGYKRIRYQPRVGKAFRAYYVPACEA